MNWIFGADDVEQGKLYNTVDIANDNDGNKNAENEDSKHNEDEEDDNSSNDVQSGGYFIN